jgi:hypothetical protein
MNNRREQRLLKKEEKKVNPREQITLFVNVFETLYPKLVLRSPGKLVVGLSNIIRPD